MLEKSFIRSGLALLSGIMAFLAFPPFNLSFMAWICFLPLFFVIKNTDDAGAFLYSYLSGLVFFGSLLYWLVHISVPGMVTLVFILALFYAIFGFMARVIFKYSMEPMILPFIWVVLEYLRSNLFTGFPWGLLSYSQYENLKFIQIADITGSYGISFIIVFFNIAFFSYITKEERRHTRVAGALFLIIFSLVYSQYKLDNQLIWCNARISSIQGNIPQKLKWDENYARHIINEYSGLVKEAARDDPDMIVLPETSYPYLLTNEDDAEEIRRLSSGLDVPVLFGAVDKEGWDYFNSAVLYSDKGTVTRKYRKTHLVPFGEYIPFEGILKYIRDLIDKPIGDYTPGDEYTLFPLKTTIHVRTGDGAIRTMTYYCKFGVLICFEDIFPYISRRFTRAGADFLVNITNDAWFGDTAAPEQHLQASVFRAVENRLSLIRSANTGISCFIEPSGEITSFVSDGGEKIFVKGFKTGMVRMFASKSFYSAYGDVFVVFCGVMMTILLLTEQLLIRKEDTVRG